MYVIDCGLPQPQKGQMQSIVVNRKVVTVTVLVIAIITCTTAIAEAVDKTELINALIKVESGGNNHAIGDLHMTNKAYGPLQIRKLCVDDVNSRYGTSIDPRDLLGDRAKSIWVCQKYLEMYATQKRLGKEPTYEDMARIWNGGPNGWKQNSTLGYWSKVQKQLTERRVCSVPTASTPKKVEVVKPKWKPNRKIKLNEGQLTMVAKK